MIAEKPDAASEGVRIDQRLEDEASRARRLEAAGDGRAGVEPAPSPGGRPEKRLRHELRRRRGY
ncbi:MAG: hypothetical protein IT531_18255 [Burkholderiales bacterium]|nr:hypothetical protein [Burkholderiales bacterium]